MTVTSRLHRQKDTERQRKTEENVEIRPVVARRYESVMMMLRVSWVYSKREKAESEFGIDKEKKCKSEDHG